jgi:hypothetical protein
MIPSCIEREHLLEALRLIKLKGIPDNRRSRDYCLIHDDGDHYPPKYVISLGHKFATGSLLPAKDFSGGVETNEFVRAHEFQTARCGCRQPKRSIVPVPNLPINPNPGHSAHCRECKACFRQLLNRIYGTYLPEHHFDWSIKLEDYRDTSIYEILNTIYLQLQNFRGFSSV